MTYNAPVCRLILIPALLFTACQAQPAPEPVVANETWTAVPALEATATIPDATITPIPPTATATPDATEIALAATADWLPIFDQFVEDMKNGNADQIVGIWVENILALRVVYQPASDPGYVSTNDDEVTYFLYPWQKAGNHGLLAHNYLAGRYFFNLNVGDIITLVFGDGDYMDFEITEIKEFQALQPDNPYGNFIDLESGEQLTVNNVFIEVYMGDFHTTLQTCIASGIESEWGRQFVLAPPLY